MKDFPAAFQRQTESYEFSLRFCSLQDAEQAARDLIDFLMAGVRPKKETAPEPPKEAKERQKTIPSGPIADDLNRYMQEHGYSEREMAKVLGTSQNSINHWRRGICMPTGRCKDVLFSVLYGNQGGDSK